MLNSVTQHLPVGSGPKVHQIPSATLSGGASATAIAAVAVPAGMQVLIEVQVFAKDATAGENAVYQVIAAGKNTAGTTALIGSPSIVALEEDATWVLTVAANDTDDTLDVMATPDGTNDTDFVGTYTAYFQAI